MRTHVKIFSVLLWFIYTLTMKIKLRIFFFFLIFREIKDEICHNVKLLQKKNIIIFFNFQTAKIHTAYKIHFIIIKVYKFVGKSMSLLNRSYLQRHTFTKDLFKVHSTPWASPYAPFESLALSVFVFYSWLYRAIL